MSLLRSIAPPDFLTESILPPNLTMAWIWTSGFLLPLMILMPLWFIASKCLKKPTRLRSVVVFVLGDVGRSPRMMYHAESFANNGFETYIVGYRGMCRYGEPSRLIYLDNMNCRFKANTCPIVNPSCPVLLPLPAPPVLLPSTFYGHCPYKDNPPSFSHLHHPLVHNPKYFRVYNRAGWYPPPKQIGLG